MMAAVFRNHYHSGVCDATIDVSDLDGNCWPTVLTDLTCEFLPVDPTLFQRIASTVCAILFPEWRERRTADLKKAIKNNDIRRIHAAIISGAPKPSPEELVTLRKIGQKAGQKAANGVDRYLFSGINYDDCFDKIEEIYKWRVLNIVAIVTSIIFAEVFILACASFLLRAYKNISVFFKFKFLIEAEPLAFIFVAIESYVLFKRALNILFSLMIRMINMGAIWAGDCQRNIDSIKEDQNFYKMFVTDIKNERNNERISHFVELLKTQLKVEKETKNRTIASMQADDRYDQYFGYLRGNDVFNAVLQNF